MNESTVLCVDDEPAILEALQRVLVREGYNILMARSGEEALKIIESHCVDVVISDAIMPGMQGSDLLSWIREKHPNIKRILLTGHYEQGDVVLPAVNSAEVFRLLPKPWDPGELKQAIKDAVVSAK